MSDRKHRSPLTLGEVVATPNALQALAAHNITPASLLARHADHDWGEALPPEDVAANNAALMSGGRILSAYLVAPELRIWIITEHDRSVSTLLLPSEY